MRYGFVVPGGGTVQEQVELLVAADAAGWDAAFTFESAYGPDPWSLLAVAASRTSRVLLGTMLTPLAWRRPWKVASQLATLDHLSGGRAMLSVGLGAPDTVAENQWDSHDRATRARRLDDGIDLLHSLWSGAGAHEGPEFQVRFNPDTGGAFRPVQDPPPIWCVGAVGSDRSMQRVLRCQGLLPTIVPFRPAVHDDIRQARAWLDEHGGDGIDIVQEGTTTPDSAADEVAAWGEAGVTWWIEAAWGEPLEAVRARLVAGPPS